MAALYSVLKTLNQPEWTTISTLLSMRIALLLAVGLLLTAIACSPSDSGSSPSLVTTSTPIPTLPPPTATPQPTSTPVPTSTPEPTNTPTPTPEPTQKFVSKGDQVDKASIDDSLLPIAVFLDNTPEEIMGQFPDVESECIKEHFPADRMAEILQTASPTLMEGIVIASCLESATFVRVLLGSMLPEAGTFSDATNACLTERMSDPGLVDAAGLYIMTSMGSIDDPAASFELVPFLLCLDDGERAGADLDLDAAECLANELDPADLSALGTDDALPSAAMAAMEKCGVSEPPN